MNKQKKISSGVLIYAALFSLLLWFAWKISMGGVAAGTISYSEMVAQFQAENVKNFSLKDNVLTIELYNAVEDNSIVRCEITDPDFFREDLGQLVEKQYESGVLQQYNYLPDSTPSLIVSILPYLICGIVLVFVFVMLMNRSANNQGMNNFGKANIRFGSSGKVKKTFADVAGLDEEKEELQEIVDYLRNPDKYNAIGAKVPKGVLLVGPPGTGKTLIAKAVAGEADVQFLSISGSDFVEMYVGVGASRVRDLFETAKKLAPSIVFIDEIDAVGRKRGAGLGGGHDEKEQTLNQLLVEMDGFAENSGVIVLAATNRKDILDPALLRPGRFDRQVYIGYPNAKGREEILKVHAKNKPLADDVNLHTIALAVTGFTGAALENLLNEAALLAARANRPVVTMADMEEAMMKVYAGPKKKSHQTTTHEIKLTAYHEAGHAVSMYYLPTCEPVHQITIIPRGQTGGMTISIPEQDTLYSSRNEMYDTIVSFLGGRIAEALEFGDITTGASNDIQRATGIARDMVARYGMSDRIGTVSYDEGNEIFVGRDYERTRSYSEHTAGMIDEEVKVIMDRAYAHCSDILSTHRDQLAAVAEYLIAHDTMSRTQFEACMKGEEIPEDTGASLFEQINAGKTEPAPQETAPAESGPMSDDLQAE